MDSLTQALEEAARLAGKDANREAVVYRQGDRWLALPSSSGILGQIDATWSLVYTVTAA